VHGVDAHFAFDPPPSTGTASFGPCWMISIGFSVPAVSNLVAMVSFSLVGHDLIGDHGLFSIHRHMLHSDLLLSSTSMLVETFGQECYGPRGLVGKL
jgi:hypothetical protein